MPPFPYRFLASKILTSGISLHFLEGEKGTGLLIKIDGVVIYACFFQNFLYFGPQLTVTFPVLFPATWFQVHFKCFTFFHEISGTF